MKRIITCSDGTWNKPGEKDRGIEVETNVEKIHDAITSKSIDGTPQLKFYDQGVGTSASLQDEIMGGATGKGIDKNILDAYKFILWNFEPGDELYLFGFSRGAYTARSLAGFIRYCGILRPENLLLANEAYQLYHDKTKLTGPDSDLMVSFRRQYSIETRIKFIGVWDTVGSLGIPLKSFKELNTEKYQFHDVTLSSTVDFAYHALAINERRELFEPTLWEKSSTVKNTPGHKQMMEQVWFTGVHSNVGGGYEDSGLSDIALEWMMKKAENTGLSFDRSEIKDFKPNPEGELRNSLNLLYRILGKKWREVCKSKDGNESIDPSVRQRYNHTGEKLPPNLAELKPTK
ncbi:MAG: DUF2235 domain-containing protein [Bacteroidetes bacterium]|nr:DUF2235 domain-containing protein [Bacteroidota bacterium]